MGSTRGDDAAFLLTYGAAHGAKSLIWHASQLMFAFFLTEAVGLRPTSVGLILSFSLLLNAAMDLVLGWLVRYRVTSSLAAARMQLLGAIGSGIALVIFACAGHLPASLRFGFSLVSMVAFRCTYPFMDNPQNAMLAFATADDGGRARIASSRYVVGGAAQLLLGGLFAPMMIGADAPTQSFRFVWLCIVLAGLGVGTAIVLNLWVRRHPGVSVSGAPRHYRAASVDERKPKVAAFAVFAAALTLSASVQVFSLLNPYFTAFSVRDVFDAGLILSAAAFGSLVSQFGWSRLAQTWRLVSVLRAALLTMLAGAVLFYVGSGRSGVLVAACVVVYGIGSGGVMMSVWSLLAGVASERGSPFPGTAAFGLYTCCSKLGHAVSAGVVGLILAGADYRDPAVAAGPIVAWMAAAPILGIVIVAALTTGVGGRTKNGAQPEQASTLPKRNVLRWTRS